MKAVLLLLSLATCSATAQLGGSEHIIKQHAKDLANQNNAQQGVAPPAQPGQPSAPAPVPVSPEQLSLSRFSAGLAAIKANDQLTAEKKQQLATALSGAVQGAKPAPDAVKKAVEDLTAAFSEKPLPADKRARLVQEIDAIVNPAKFPQAKLPAIYDDIQSTFQLNGLARKDAENIVLALKGLSPDAQTK